MAGEEVRVIRNNINEMKKVVEDSEEYLLKGIETLSRNLPIRSCHMFFDVRDMKQYAAAILKREDMKLKEDMADLEKRMSHLELRVKDIQTREIEEYTTRYSMELADRSTEGCINWKRTS